MNKIIADTKKTSGTNLGMKFIEKNSIKCAAGKNKIP
jgi:hypothetical protein